MNGTRRLIGSFNHGSMANALPQAVGAQMAYPNRQVISLSGDGGLAMLMGDLLTIPQYQLPLKIVLFNNHRLGMVQLEMEAAGLPHYGCELKNPDFAAYARAFGGHGETVEKTEDFAAAFERALAVGKPAIIHVKTDPEALTSRITLSKLREQALAKAH